MSVQKLPTEGFHTSAQKTTLNVVFTRLLEKTYLESTMGTARNFTMSAFCRVLL